MSLEQPAATDEPTTPPPAADDDGIVEAVTVGQQKMVPLEALKEARASAKALKAQMAELQPQIDRAAQVSRELESLQPTLQALQRMTPAQRDALASGKTPSPEGTPHNDQDVEARELAEDLGLIAQDGSLDISRARKRLDKDNARIERMLESRVAPVRQSAAAQQAATIRQQAKGITDNTGTLLATAESIDEAYAMLPPELAANPNTALVAIGTAMAIDRMKNRKVQQPAQDYGAPLYSEPMTGRRGPSISAEERELAKKVGLTDKDLTAAATAIQQGGRGVRME